MQTVKSFAIIAVTCASILIHSADNQAVPTPPAPTASKTVEVAPIVVMKGIPVYKAISPTHRSDPHNPFPHMASFWPITSVTSANEPSNKPQ